MKALSQSPTSQNCVKTKLREPTANEGGYSQRRQADTPLVLIDTETGRLCDQRECMVEFEADPKFMELVASMTKLDKSRIRQVVQEYFRYATFSYTWEGAEPLPRHPS